MELVTQEMRIKGIFNQPSNVLLKDTGALFNCHVCGKVFSPIHILGVLTDKRDYYFGVYCRLALYHILQEDRDKVCEHLLAAQTKPVILRTKDTGKEETLLFGYRWVYDPIKNIQGMKVDSLDT